ncbi:RapGAP/RanGAP domain-containing protein [Tieghemostelium lacteum]|uniref:RapGAP/RanGAP domain-containing protein n=1 Tax=Tieghemostelium lacteum TaxID=361077 RepID=A0A151ZEK0_TIELA|nr:RapGAP/RanGAP domain-containing protein [Tieghemostelium lacteum]|eukprot:KYQ92386.1 RapGAP/RanGAP domain-containing protein [Tieghemostelium lacteum]
MFIDWASALNLIDAEKNTGILKDYPYSVKKILVQQTVTHLLEPPNGNSLALINNKAHLSWIMEIVEQGFLLGIEDSQIITQCIELYRKWLFDPKHKPIPLQEDSNEFFLRKILEHLTLIFQPRLYPMSNTIINVQVINTQSNSNNTGNSNNISNNTQQQQQQQQQQNVINNQNSQQQGNNANSNNNNVQQQNNSINSTGSNNNANPNNILGLNSSGVIPSFRELIDTHTILCQKVLQLYLDIARALSKSFSTETFELWITLLLALTDCTLGINSITDETLARNLCPLILKVLFEIWLHSRTKNATLWNALCKYAFGWFHHMPMVNQWNLTCLALTTPLLQCIYNTTNQNAQEQQSKTILIRLDDIQLEFEKEYLYYSWHRMLNLIGNPNAIKNPNIFAAAIGGIFQLVSGFLSVTNDGNSILHIFGSWLFEAVKSIKVGFDEGISFSVEILSHIFLSCAPKIQFSSIYLSCFYSSLAEALWCDGKILLSTIIHTQNIFTSELPGSRILIPSYLRALGKILTIIPGSQSEYLRKSAIKILGSILSLPNRYESVQFVNFFPGRHMDPYPILPNDIITSKQYDITVPTEINTFADVKPHLGHLILSALNTETSSNNLPTLIWYVMIYQLEYQHQHVSKLPDGRNATTCFIQAAVNTILKKSSSFSNQWPAEVVSHSFALLSELSNYSKEIPYFQEIANNIVRKLCKFIVFKCRELSMSADTEELICLAIQTISDWVVVSPWIFEGNYLVDTSTLYMLFNALTVALGGKNPNEESSSNISLSSSASGGTSSPKVQGTPAKESKDSKESKESKESKDTTAATVIAKRYFNLSVPQRIRDIAQCSLKTILNRICYYPNPHHFSSTDTSSKLTESDLIQQIKDRALKQVQDAQFQAEQCVRFYTIDDSIILTVIDQPTFSPGQPNYCTLIVRDMSGKSIVNTQLAYTPFKVKENKDDKLQDEILSDGGGGDDNETSIPDQPLSTGANVSLLPSVQNGAGNGPFKSLYSENTEDTQDLLQYITKHQDESFSQLFKNQIKIELDLLESLNYSLSGNITITPPTLKNCYQGDCKLQQARILLSQLGFINHYSQCKLLPLDNSIAFYQSLQMLDAVSERTQTKVPVLFIKSADQTEDDYLNNVTLDTTTDYSDFISGLGWGVPLATHSGFNGEMDKKHFTHGKVAPYYSNHNKEMIFHVSTLIPNQPTQPQQEHKKKLLSKSSVAIVWYQGLIEHYEKHLLDQLPNSIQIVISPISASSQLYRVKTVKKMNSPNTVAKMKCGPVIDDVIVSKHILANLVKSTAQNLSQGLLNITGENTTKLSNQFLSRKKLIQDISESFKKEVPNFQFYNSLFEQTPPELIYQAVEHLPQQGTFKFTKSTSVNFKPRPQSMLLGQSPINTQNQFIPTSPSGGGAQPTFNRNSHSPQQLPQPGSPSLWGNKIEPTSKVQPPHTTHHNTPISNPTNRISNFLTNRKLNLSNSNSGDEDNK